MTARPLTIVSRTQGCNAALKDGTVQADGLDLRFEEVPVLVHAFRRMVREQAYDVCEMAITTYLCAREHGVPMTALPIFLARGLHHGAMYTRAGGGVEPGDLAGRKVGVNRGYTVTTGVWARAILEEEHGLDLERVTWAPSGDEHVEAYRAPEYVQPLPGGSDLAELVLDGTLDAAVGAEAPDDRFVPLVDDPDAAALRALRERGLYPINHLVVVRDDVLAEDPTVAVAVTEAFVRAKQAQLHALEQGGSLAPTSNDALHREVAEVTGGDPLPYGIAPNEATLDRLLDHALRQRILTRRPAIEDLFAPAVRELVG